MRCYFYFAEPSPKLPKEISMCVIFQGQAYGHSSGRYQKYPLVPLKSKKVSNKGHGDIGSIPRICHNAGLDWVFSVWRLVWWMVGYGRRISGGGSSYTLRWKYGGSICCKFVIWFDSIVTLFDWYLIPCVSLFQTLKMWSKYIGKENKTVPHRSSPPHGNQIYYEPR